MKSLLIILEVGDIYPSGYLRALIHHDNLLKHGFTVKYVSRQCVSLARLRHKPSRLVKSLSVIGLGVLIVLLQRIISLINEWRIVYLAREYDVIYLSTVSSFRFVQRLRKKTKARLVLDFGDALWLFRKRFNDLLALVDTVTTDNEYTASYARQFNNNCTVVPDSPQIEIFDNMRSTVNDRNDNLVILGWVGSPSSVSNLYLIVEPLEHLFSKHPNLHLRLVGVGFNRNLLSRFNKIKYSFLPYYTQSEMVEEVLKMDIGLFPLYNTEASIARGVHKAAVYMSGEAAVVCSPIGQCTDLIKDGVNGMLANSSAEWEEKLELLVTNPNLRKQIAKSGLEIVRRDFSLEKCFLKLLPVLQG